MEVMNALALPIALEILRSSASVATWNAVLTNNVVIMHSVKSESTAKHSVTVHETILTETQILNVRTNL